MRLLQRRTSSGVGLHAWRALAGQHAPHVALVHGEGRTSPQGHDPGHAPGDPLRQRLGYVTHAGGQAAVGQVLRPGAPTA